MLCVGRVELVVGCSLLIVDCCAVGVVRLVVCVV